MNNKPIKLTPAARAIIDEMMQRHASDPLEKWQSRQQLLIRCYLAAAEDIGRRGALRVLRRVLDEPPQPVTQSEE